MIYRNTNDVQNRIDALTSEFESKITDELLAEHGGNIDCEDIPFLEQLDPKFDVDELVDLLKFKSYFEFYNNNWNRSESLILQGTEALYFAENDDIIKDIPSYIVINWEQTAKNMLMDYVERSVGWNIYYFRVI